MKKILLTLIGVASIGLLSAQFYEDASDQLSENGARRQSMDVVVADLNGDLYPDVVLANEFQGNTILINDGQGNFSDGSAGLPQLSKDSEDVAPADYDRDGDIDLIFCSEDNINLGETNVHEFYLNDGQGNFTPAAYKLPDSEANAVISLFINQDTFPDIILGNKGQNILLINNGNGSFRDETEDRLPSIFDVTQDIQSADIDGDDDLDLIVGNEDSNRLLINDGNGFFSDESGMRLPAGVNPETRKITVADVNGDKYPDLFLSSVAFIPGRDIQDRLYLNDGDGFFTDVTSTNLPPDAIHTLDGVFDDADGDGDLDLFTVGLDIVGQSTPVRALLNNGQGVFTDATEEVLGGFYLIQGLGIIATDLNGDDLKDIYACDRKDNTSNRKDVLLLKKKLTNNTEDYHVSGAWSFSLYPNPATTSFRVSTAEALKGQPQFFLYDASGKDLGALTPVAFEEGKTWTFSSLSLVNLPGRFETSLVTGKYFLKIVAPSGSFTLPFLLE